MENAGDGTGRAVHLPAEVPMSEAVAIPVAQSVGRLALRVKVPGYTVSREISRGGQGVVVQAIQQSTGQKVAIKLMREGPFAMDGVAARFDREGKILARLRHPGIVSIIDRGETAEGSLFLVMPLIDGQPLDVYFRSRPAHHEKDGDEKHHDEDEQNLPDRLRLFQKICEAVNAAHLAGVVHRDLKPSNVLVDSFGQPQVLDFGLAHSTMAGGEAPVTISGQFLGSLPWASPEQAEGKPDRIDSRTDVYALGVMLYQLLTGEFPYEVAGNMRDVLDNIMRAQPTPPSKVIAAKLAKQALQRQRMRSKHPNPISGDLEAIVLKALQKEPARRYQSAGELATDIATYLAALPSKRAPVRGQRRSGAGLLATAAVLVAVVSVLVGLWLWKDRTASTPQRLASGPGTPAPVANHESLPDHETQPTLTLATNLITARPGMHGLIPNPSPLASGAAWQLESVPLRMEADDQPALAIAPGGNQIAVAGGGGIHIYDLPTLRLRQIYPGRYWRVAWSADGQWIAGVDLENIREIRLWHVPTHRHVRSLFGHTGIVYRLAWSPTGQLASSGYWSDLGVRIWDIDSGEHRQLKEKEFIENLDWSPDGRRLACTGLSKVLVLDTQAGEATRELLTGSTAGCAWSPDGRWLAVGSHTNDGAVHLYNTSTWEPTSWTANQSHVTDLAWSADSMKIASCSQDTWGDIWTLAGKHLHRLERPAHISFRCVAWSQAQQCIVGAYRDGTLRVWSDQDGRVLTTMRGTNADLSRISHGGAWAVVTAQLERQLRICNMLDGGPSVAIDTEAGLAVPPAWHPREPLLAVAHGSGLVQLYSTTGKVVDLANMNPATAIAWSSDGQYLAVASEKELTLCHGSSGVKRSLGEPADGKIHALSFDPSGERLACATASGRLIVLPLHDKAMTAAIDASDAPLATVGWSSDGRWLATQSSEGVLRVWNAATGEAGPEFKPQVNLTIKHYWSPTGADLAVFGSTSSSVAHRYDPLLRAWTPLWPEFAGSTMGAWSPDGTELLVLHQQADVAVLHLQSKVSRTLRVPEVRAVAWLDSGIHFTRGGSIVQTYNAQTLTCIRIALSIGPAEGIAVFSPSGEMLTQHPPYASLFTFMLQASDGTVTLTATPPR